MSYNPLLTFSILYWAFGLIMAAGFTMFVVMTLLDRSNNIGDSYNSFDDHCRSTINTNIGKNDISLEEGRRYLISYGDSPFEIDDSGIPDPLKANDDDIYGELEELDIPLFKPLNE